MARLHGRRVPRARGLSIRDKFNFCPCFFKKQQRKADSEDSYSYQEYGTNWYDEQEGREKPPLIKKKSRLISAVVQNQVELVRELLDSPRWYHVCDKWGYSLLQIAILCDNVEVFNYLLSIPDYPLEFVNRYNQTALIASLEGFVNNDIWMKEHFAYELIKRGANIKRDHVDYAQGAPLHHALERSYFRVALLLIEKGVDVNYCNYRGLTPLEQATEKNDNLEVVMALLVSGAEPSVSLFEDSILHNLDEQIQETMFLLLFDEYSKVEIGWEAVLRLAERHSPMLDELLKFPIEISFYSDNIAKFIWSCCSIRIETLRIILTKLSPNLNVPVVTNAIIYHLISPPHLKNLEVLLETDLKPSVISFIRHLDTNGSFRYLYQMPIPSDIVKTCCYLLSYGLVLHEDDLNIVYHKFGYGEFFKILLHMDVTLTRNHQHSLPNWVWPLFLYNVRLDLETILQNPQDYGNLRKLINYFRDARLVRYLNDSEPEEPKISVRVPLLAELARNTFRKHFIQTFNITNSRMFYTLVNHLDVNMVYKKIITYEKKLY